jgi:tryptophan synthase beta chain
MLNDSGRVSYGIAYDDEVIDAFRYLSVKEGIIPALESAHAIAYAINNADRFDRDDIVVICLSGRGDKDVATVSGMMEENKTE